VRRWLLAGAAGAVLLALAGGALLLDDGDQATAAADAAAPSSATVERRDLVERETLDGTLGYGDERLVAAAAAGTVTAARSAGAIVRRGQMLVEVDGAPVRLLYGTTPLWRRLAEGVADGRDVRQLEHNLRALGYDPGTVDASFTSETATALRAWEDDGGAGAEGALGPGDAVFLPGPRRIAAVSAPTGTSVQPGAALLETTGTEAAVSVEIDARDQELVRRGQRVGVRLPSGRRVAGTVEEIASVAVAALDAQGQAGDPTIAVTIGLRDTRARDGLDGAPVDVDIETGRAAGVLAVPVEALLALAGGGFAVETTGAGAALLPVQTGAFADGWVEIRGQGIRAGLVVVVPE
jgi:peptidoglycan hydrolase-like protein with peptidoglycan-binding domain